MIAPLDRREGHSRVIVTCDDCQRRQYENADYERRHDGSFVANEGQVLHRLNKHGWTYVKKHLRCPACTLAKKVEMRREKDVLKPSLNVVTDMRKPSREQKRQIVDLLTSVYDVSKERYTGSESDVTVAEAIGGGCMFGWVAEVRDELFGPDGKNEELEALTDALARFGEDNKELYVKACAAVSEIEAACNQVREMQKRLDVLVKAAGPRARA